MKLENCETSFLQPDEMRIYYVSSSPRLVVLCATHANVGRMTFPGKFLVGAMPLTNTAKMGRLLSSLLRFLWL
ncbi:MAG: hypothetical protein ACRC2T_04950 [Thermoguttaceae bacterium]